MRKRKAEEAKKRWANHGSPEIDKYRFLSNQTLKLPHCISNYLKEMEFNKKLELQISSMIQTEWYSVTPGLSQRPLLQSLALRLWGKKGQRRDPKLNRWNTIFSAPSCCNPPLNIYRELEEHPHQIWRWRWGWLKWEGRDYFFKKINSSSASVCAGALRSYRARETETERDKIPSHFSPGTSSAMVWGRNTNGHKWLKSKQNDLE